MSRDRSPRPPRRATLPAVKDLDAVVFETGVQLTWSIPFAAEGVDICAAYFDGDGMGGNIAILHADAQIVLDYNPAHEVAAYVQKYNYGFSRIKMSAEEFGNSYSIPILFLLTGITGH